MIMSFLHLNLVALLAIYGSFNLAAGVVCPAKIDCVKTKFTKATCENGICGCEFSYVSIETGCGKRLDKPAVSFDNTSPNVVWAYDGTKNVTLKCDTQIMPDEDKRIIWKFGSELLKETSAKLKIDISSATVASAYKCVVAPKSNLDSNITSDESEDFKITLLNPNTLPGGNWQPILGVTRKSVFGQRLPLSCSNLPIGISLNANIEFFSNLSSSAISNEYHFDQDVELSCKVTISDPQQSVESDKVTVTQVNDIDGVIISIVDHPNDFRSLTVKTGDPVTLQCKDNGEVAIPVVFVTSYFWMIDNETKSAAREPLPFLLPSLEYVGLNDQYIVNTSVPGRTNYKCGGEYGSSNITESSDITITVEDEPIPVPVVKIVPEQAKPGSHIRLNCGGYVSPNVTYKWKKNGKFILGQYDRIIQMRKTRLVEGTYNCSASKDGYTVFSTTTVTVTGSAIHLSASLFGITIAVLFSQLR